MRIGFVNESTQMHEIGNDVLPASELYDCSRFQQDLRLLQEHADYIYICSSHYGLIGLETPISTYDTSSSMARDTNFFLPNRLMSIFRSCLGGYEDKITLVCLDNIEANVKSALREVGQIDTRYEFQSLSRL